MAGTIGSVTVELAANIAKFESSLKQASSIAENQMKSIDKSLGIVKTSLGLLGAGFLANATFDKIKEKILGTIESAASLQKISEQAGVSASALSGLASVAKLSGTDTADLATGLQKLSKSMVDASNGGSKTSAAFEAIGISAKDIANQKPDEVFQRIAVQQAKYGDGAGKTAAIIQLLGKSGANLLPVLNDLSTAGILQAKVTNEQAKQAEEYEQNLKRMEAASNALYKTIGFALLPVLDEVTKAFLETQTSTNGVKKTVNELAADGSILHWAQDAALGAGTIIESLIAIGKTAAAVGGSFQAVGADIKTFYTFTKNGALPGLAFKSNRDELSAVLDERNKTLDTANKRYVDLWNYDGAALTKNLQARFAGMNAEADFAKNADARDLRMRAEANKAAEAPRAQVKFNPNKEANAAKNDDSKKRLEGQLKEQDAFINRAKKQAETYQQNLDFYVQQQYVTEAQALEVKKTVIEQELAAEETGYAKQLAAADAYLKQTLTPPERAEGNTKRQEILDKRLAAEIDAQDKIAKVLQQRGSIQRDLDLSNTETVRQQNLANDAAQFQIDLLGKSTLETQKLTSAKQIQLALDESIRQAQLRDKDVDVSGLIATAAQQTEAAGKLIEASYLKQRDGAFGASEAIRKYGEDASNTAAQIESTLGNAFKGAEDALVQFTTTGKLSFSSLAQSIIADLARMQAKAAVSGLLNFLGNALGNALTANAYGTNVGSQQTSMLQAQDSGLGLAGRRASGGPVGAGGRYLVGENGPEVLSMGGSSGTIIPNSALGGAGAPSVTQNMTFNIDSRSDAATIRDSITRAVAQSKAEIADAIARGSRQYTRLA